MLSSQEKEDIAKDADAAINHEFVLNAMKEFASNMDFSLDGLPKYGLMKIAHITASVAIACERNIDPEDLRITQEEFLQAVKEYVKHGHPWETNNVK